jgi:DNA recombination protein RmuC
MTMLDIVLIGLCAALAVCCAWLLVERSWQSAEKARLATRNEELERDLAEAAADREKLETRAEEIDRKLAEINVEAATLRANLEGAKRARKDDEQKLKALRETFDSFASEALDKSTQRFLKLAGETFAKHQETAKNEHEQRRQAVEKLVTPIAESLKKTDEQLKKLEADRVRTSATLLEKFEAEERQRLLLTTETRKLTDALRKPEVRGRYGEIQLQRVAEIAGMASYCDFDTQRTIRSGAGATLRPDMVVRLPNDRVVVVDAKANIEPYLRAIDAETEGDRDALLERFADGIARQAKDLAKKEYWSQFEHSPEFVVMFVPGDQFVDAALQRKPNLLDDAAQCNVILASPSTLIGLLRAVHVGWREMAVSESARELMTLGRELHERSAKVLEHISKVGRGLNAAVGSYNDLVGSVDARLLPTLRKFEDAGAKSAKELDELPPVEVRTRDLADARALSAPD